MSTVEFQDQQSRGSSFTSRTILGSSQTPSMVKFLVGKKIVKNEKAAGMFLLTITIFFFLVSIIIFWVAFGYMFKTSSSNNVSSTDSNMP